MGPSGNHFLKRGGYLNDYYRKNFYRKETESLMKDIIALISVVVMLAWVAGWLIWDLFT